MKSVISIKVGDKIVDYDQINVVCEISKGLIYYYPLFQDNKSKNVKSYIPLDSFKKAGIRQLMTKSEANIFLESFTKQPPLELPTNYKNNNLKEFLYLNDPYKNAQLLSFLWKNHQLSTFTKSDQSILEQVLKVLSNEISVATDISPEKAKSKILHILEK